MTTMPTTTTMWGLMRKATTVETMMLSLFYPVLSAQHRPRIWLRLPGYVQLATQSAATEAAAISGSWCGPALADAPVAGLRPPASWTPELSEVAFS